MTPILAAHIQKKGYKTVGLLATYATIHKKICDKDLHEKGIQFIVPNKSDQHIVEQVILHEIAGRTTPKDVEELKRVIWNLQQNGAEAILIACTELPLVIKQSEINMPLVDCSELYTQYIAQYSKK